jgi:hypothetical protein
VTQFAVYLVKYPGLTITYEGTTLDPATIVARDTEIELDADLGGDHGAPVLRIMEWTAEARTITPSLVLCDENGVALHEITSEIESPPELRGSRSRRSGRESPSLSRASISIRAGYASGVVAATR